MFKQSQKLSAGVTLLEMMVALLVLSIGLLGVATLQSRGQQFNQVAYLRTQATFLAYDLMERIKINEGTRIRTESNFVGGIYKGSSEKNYELCGNDIDSATGCDENSCFPDDLVKYDKAQWCGLLLGTLPGGSAILDWTADASGTQHYQMTIQWKNILDSKNDTEARTWRLYL